MGRSGERRNDMAAILAQLFAVREMNGLKHPAWSVTDCGIRPDRQSQAGVITDGFRWEFFIIQKVGHYNVVHSALIEDAHTEEDSKRRVLGDPSSKC